MNRDIEYTVGKIEATPEFLEKNYTEENIGEIRILLDLNKIPQELYQQIQQILASINVLLFVIKSLKQANY